MRSLLFTFLFLFLTTTAFAQEPVRYRISFERAVHHEADIEISYTGLEPGELRIRMSRSSPGRYAVHEFAKNVYGLHAVDPEGNLLELKRTSPHEWLVSGHEGSLKVRYTLFANHGDGTYAQIDESHAHLNIPATFAYAPDLQERPIEIEIDARRDLNWHVATQLKSLGENQFYAPNLQYFMDSPIEASDHRTESFTVSSGDKEATVKFVLHQENGYEGLKEYALRARDIVNEEIGVFGELPDFDFGTYTFLACYAPHVDGDGMEHRNSTVLTSTRSLSAGGHTRNIGTVAHEFFHAWNVERIRPESLEPFDFTDSNMSGELWFAEGFTSYYTSLILCRTRILSPEDYVERLGSLLSYVVNSPGREIFGPVEMSQQAPFVDAATAVDEVNRDNTFISYYSYGNVLGLALDLLLREDDSGKNLDDFMKLVWIRHGREEIPYTLEDLQSLLREYSSEEFAEMFFSRYIYGSELPDFNSLLASFGVEISVADPELAHLGARIVSQEDEWLIESNPLRGSALYESGFSKGDLILAVDERTTDGTVSVEEFMKEFDPDQVVEVTYSRFGKTGNKQVKLGSDPRYKTTWMKNIDAKTKARRDAWLASKQTLNR